MNQTQYNRMRTLEALEYGIDNGMPLSMLERLELMGLRVLYVVSNKTFEWTSDNPTQ